MEIISTGYPKLDELIGGGFVKGSTNLIVEWGGPIAERGCLGDLFLLLLLKKRIEKGDIGLIDCYSMNPEQMMNYAKTHNIDLTKAYNEKKVYFFDFSSVEETKRMLGEIDLNRLMASKYVEIVKTLIPKGDVFNVLISLSEYIMRHGTEAIYTHLTQEKERYESAKRTSVYLVEGTYYSRKYIDKLMSLFDSVTILKISMWKKGLNADKEYRRILSVDKSPLRYSKVPVDYKIEGKPAKIRFL
ncbi:MAG: hypothetical protein KJ886_02180 [Candidatus Thermoplasmatota archaeon]|nr:hypothetical protein [Candidatus Thermoplasmatota archaeon]